MPALRGVCVGGRFIARKKEGGCGLFEKRKGEKGSTPPPPSMFNCHLCSRGTHSSPFHGTVSRTLGVSIAQRPSLRFRRQALISFPHLTYLFVPPNKCRIGFFGSPARGATKAEGERAFVPKWGVCLRVKIASGWVGAGAIWSGMVRTNGELAMRLRRVLILPLWLSAELSGRSLCGGGVGRKNIGSGDERGRNEIFGGGGFFARGFAGLEVARESFFFFFYTAKSEGLECHIFGGGKKGKKNFPGPFVANPEVFVMMKNSDSEMIRLKAGPCGLKYCLL